MDVPREEPALKADPEHQLRLLDVQALDARLAQLAHKRATLPEHVELATRSARLAELRDLVVAAETEDGDIAREQARAEADVDQVRARADRDQRRLDAGQVGSPKELQSLQHEIGSLARRQADLEDVVLDLMERREAAQARLAALAAERDTVTEEAATLSASRDAATAELDAEAERVTAERAAAADGLPDDLLTLYDKLRGQFGGVGAARLHRRRCEGCRLEVNAAELGAIRAAPPDEVLRCQECRRILVRTPESGL